MKIKYLILIYTLTPCIVFAMHVKDLSAPITFMGKKKTLNEWLYSVNHDLAECHKFGEGTSIIDATDMPTFHKLGNVDDLNLETINSINQGNFIYFKDIKIKDHIYYGTLVTHKNPCSIDLVEIKAHYFEHRLKKTLIQKLNLQTDTTPFFCYPESTITVHRTTKRFYEWINLCWTYDLCWRYKNKTKPDDELKDELKIEYDKYKKSFGDTQVFCSIDTEPYFKEIGTINTLDNNTLDDLKKGAYYFPNVLRGISAFLLAPEKKPWTYKGFFLKYYFKTLLEKSDEILENS